MGSCYSQLTESDRLLIESMLARGNSQRSIARCLGVAPSTVCREVQRGARSVPGWPGAGWYIAELAQRSRQAARRRAGWQRRKLRYDVHTPLWRAVLSGLHFGWSPQQIAGRLKALPASLQDLGLRVSHETIYCAIYAMPRGALRTELVKLLRNSHAGRLPRARGRRRSFQGIPNPISIAERPAEVAARIVPGHWEGDLLKGARNASAVGTLVERTSRYLMLVRLDGLDAKSVLEGFTRRLRNLPEHLRRSLTYDRGTEMSMHETLSRRLALDVYFCDPYSPWQRGTNENTNGLLREYMPKGVDLSTYADRDLAKIEFLLNNRPRKVLGFKTPAEVFDELLSNLAAGVALQA